MAFGTRSKKYWIIPQASLSPDDLVIGSILKKPQDPIDILNRHAVEAIDSAHVIQEREQPVKTLTGSLDTGIGSKLGISTALAAILGASPTLEGSWKKGDSDAIEATNVRAKHFIPPNDYVDRALRTPVVDAFVRQSFFTAPVHMVVGVAVASTLSRTAATSGDRAGKVGVGIGPPGTGVEISAEVSANRAHTSSYHDSVVEEVVLAYRVRRFRYSKRRDEFIRRDQDETKHARYSAGQEYSEEQEDENDDMNEVANFSYFDDEDVIASSIGLVGFGESNDDENDSAFSRDN